MDADVKTSTDRLRESVDALRVAIQAASDDRRGGTGSRETQERLRGLAQPEQDGLISDDEYSGRKDEMLREWSR